jgi:hypothetical protein
VNDVELALITEIYDRSCLSRVINEYSSSLLVSVVKDSAHETVVRFSDVSGGILDDGAIPAFLNRLLDLSVEAALQSSPK